MPATDTRAAQAARVATRILALADGDHDRAEGHALDIDDPELRTLVLARIDAAHGR